MQNQKGWQRLHAVDGIQVYDNDDQVPKHCSLSLNIDYQAAKHMFKHMSLYMCFALAFYEYSLMVNCHIKNYMGT